MCALLKNLKLVVIALSVILMMPSQTMALSPNLLKPIPPLIIGAKWAGKALPESKIVELAVIAGKPGGTKEVGKTLATMKLPLEALEDAYARILIAQNKVTREVAEGWIARLTGTPGFTSAMSKTIGVSAAKTSGHLTEINIADNAVKQGMKAKGIGVRFNDGRKKADTDIDVLLERQGRVIAIESKNYDPATDIPLDSFRADMYTLAEYKRQFPESNVLPVFWMANKPNDDIAWRLLEKAAEKNGVELIVGAPEEAIHLIPTLLKG